MFGRRASGPPKEAVYDFETIPLLAPSPKYVFSALVQHTTTCTLYTDLRQWRFDSRSWFPAWAQDTFSIPGSHFYNHNPLRRERFQSSYPIASYTLHPCPPHTKHPASHSYPA
ncbi:hypothetical protein BDV93DRAFT_107273 [Ceratobasidium sp. AG-I]|nr:hypothetical protein BDV93DRAFT_107273 [Ceratobasidium sp. AG-I]